MMDAETALAELITSTGPLSGLIVAVFVWMRAELRRRFEHLEASIEKLQQSDASLERRVAALELDIARRIPTIPPAIVPAE